MDRRQALCAIPLASLAREGHAFSPPSCQTHLPTSNVVVDMHCHILNVRDVDRNQFAARRVFDIDERRNLLRWLIAKAAHVPYGLAGTRTISVTDENQLLFDHIKVWRQYPERFCSRAFTPTKLLSTDKSNYETSDGYRHPTAGFWNTRISNAVRMMQEYPEVDLFTPSMVDFNEGDPDLYSNIDTNSIVYERVAQATYGRIVPIVCFNPHREVEWRQNKRRGGKPKGHGPLDLVKVAVEKRGFIGVKLHPSVGFSPEDNTSFGCPNTHTQNKWQIQYHRQHLGHALDTALMDLYEYCMASEVPILTHGSTGISAYAACMHPAVKATSDWTNSTAQWGRLINRLSASHPGLKPLKVCIGHFAGAFSSETPWLDWLDTLTAQMRDYDELYVDLSIQSGLVDAKGKLNESNAELLRNYLAKEPILEQRMLYGSDWHMLSVTQSGPAYYSGLRELMPANIRSSVMGSNALKFLGLRKNDVARQRLNDYYAWLKKVDRWPADYQPTWMIKVDALA